MKKCMRLASIPIILFIGACGGDAAETEMAGDPAASEQGASTQAPEPTHDMSAMPMTAQFQGLQDSGVAGDATVTGRGNQTEVVVRLSGLDPGASRPGHIHTGTCDAIGGVVQPLQPVAADSAGAGTMTATVDVPANIAMNGQHILVYHGEGGVPITCAPIPAHMM